MKKQIVITEELVAKVMALDVTGASVESQLALKDIQMELLAAQLVAARQPVSSATNPDAEVVKGNWVYKTTNIGYGQKTAITSNTVAVKHDNGEVSYLNVKAFGDIAEAIAANSNKGDFVKLALVPDKKEAKKWVVEEFTLLYKKGSKSQGTDSPVQVDVEDNDLPF